MTSIAGHLKSRPASKSSGADKKSEVGGKCPVLFGVPGALFVLCLLACCDPYATDLVDFSRFVVAAVLCLFS